MIVVTYKNGVMIGKDDRQKLFNWWSHLYLAHQNVKLVFTAYDMEGCKICDGGYRICDVEIQKYLVQWYKIWCDGGIHNIMWWIIW